MSTRMLGAAVGLLAVVLMVSGCGGSADSSETVKLSKAEFIRQGDAICEKARQAKAADLEVEIQRISREGDLEELTLRDQEDLVLNVVLPTFEQMSAELSALNGPSSPGARAVARAFARTVSELKENPEIVTTRRNVFYTADEKAAAYGFKVCNEIY